MRNGSRSTATDTRRGFLRTTAASAAGGMALSEALLTRAHAGEGPEQTIPIALVGCGGRGTGAAFNALSTSGPTKLVALADVFPDRMESSIKQISEQKSSQFDVPPERRFLGMDAYKQAIDCVAPGGLVLLTTPPAFRPIHVEYAVSKGCHVFMEKSFGVDAPGVRRIMKAGEAAQAKNLKIAGGLMSRHYRPLEEAVQQIHDGAIGEVITCCAYRMHDIVGFRPKDPNESELQHQIRNYSCYTWLNGSFILDWLIHNLDICCWVKGAWPIAAQGQGGRQTRTEPDQLFDHMAIEYIFPDGTKLVAQGRHMNNCWGFFGSEILGAKGCAVLGEGIPEPKIYKGHLAAKENLVWKYDGPASNGYQVEHDLLQDAIRKDQPYNEADRCAKAALVGIMGRMAMESGQKVTWDQALASNLELAPGLDALTMRSDAPVKADAAGHYPIAMPGQTVAL